MVLAVLLSVKCKVSVGQSVSATAKDAFTVLSGKVKLPVAVSLQKPLLTKDEHYAYQSF
jgi:hypothetical protein